jgi:DNA-binding CsgD family transcriptional regulator
VAVEIVGRDDEVASLHSFFDGAGEGPGAAVLEGEPGIGKTTIWLAGIEAARERSLRVLSARPVAAEQGLAYAALADLLEGCAGEVIAELPAPRRRALETALLLDDGDGGPVDTRALAAAVTSVLRLLTRRGSLVVAVDDVQWLDGSSSAALAFALRRLDDEPVSVLLARRAGSGPTALEEALAHRAVLTLQVGPLSLGALQTLVRTRLGRLFPRPTMVRLGDVSRGNPFFALELARALDAFEGPIDPAAPLPVPETLERLVGDRLRALPSATREALLVVSVVGSPTTGLLADIGIAIEVLEPAVAMQVADVVNGEIRFTHPLLASQVLAEAGADQLREAHRLVASAVEDPIERARHVAAALDEPDETSAAALEEAAALARARGAVSVAAELGEAAMRATAPDASDLRRRRGLQAARDHLSGGSAEPAFALARSLFDEAAPGLPRAEALVLLADLEDLAGTVDQVAAYLRRALECVEGLPALEAAINQRLAMNTRICGRLDEAEGYARTALRLGEELADDALTANALAALATVRFNAGWPDAYELAARARRLATRSGDEAAITAAEWAHVHSLVWSGRHEEARPLLVALLPSAAELDEPETTTPLFYLTIVDERAGRLPLARAHAERLRELASQYGGPELGDAPTIAGMVAFVALAQGELELARELVERALAHPDSSARSSFRRFQTALLGQIAAWSGDAAGAVECFTAVEESRRAAGFALSTGSDYVSDYVEALLEVGRQGDAAAVVEEWEADARRIGNRWALPQTVRCRGLVAAAAGDVESGLALLDEAVSQHRAAGDPFGRARALLALGIIRRRARQKRPAREAIEAALAGFEAIGAAGWAEKARAELGSIGGRTRQDGLTPAERRVAALVAEGRTNREVAAALVLGERTVESHLTSVYAKLGVRSRTELARRMG